MNENQINEQAVDSNSHISALLTFQNQFINLVHSQVYNQSPITEEVIMKFQIHHTTDMNEEWKKMVEQLQDQLINRKMPYHNQLRDYFHKVLAIDYLPLLRVNRYEVTQISLYGFDIYIDPLSAILEIINRIDGMSHPISQAEPQEEFRLKQDDSWSALKKGWTGFIYESTLYKVSLNLYILKEYLKIGAKSLVRKDKQIVFTGCTNIFNIFVPRLKCLKQIWLLIQLAELNNQLYHFHPSFNYSHFYSLLFPIQEEYQPIFALTKQISEKCLNANILTPILLAILRNYQEFEKFIEQADHQCWKPYIEGIVYSLILNFKARILEYEEVMHLLKISFEKKGLMDSVVTEYIPGELAKQWGEARDFFISALKAGYNVGELQTWRPTPHMEIQSKIIDYTRNALILSSQPETEQSQLFFDRTNQEYQKLYLSQLANNKLSFDQFSTNYNEKIIEQIPLSEGYVPNLIKLIRLFQREKQSLKPTPLSYLMSFVNRAKTNSKLEMKKLLRLGQYLNSVAIKALREEKLENLSEAMFQYDRLHPQQITQQKLILYIHQQNPKSAVQKLFSLFSTWNDETKKMISAILLASFTPVNLSANVTLKTFSHEYEVAEQIVNLPNHTHSTLFNLIEETIFNKMGKGSECLDILKNMTQMAGWLVIPLLTFPINFSYQSVKEEKLQSFSLWFIKDETRHSSLIELLRYQDVEQICEYFRDVTIINICENIINETNLHLRNEEFKQAYSLLVLLYQIHTQYCEYNGVLYKKMVEMIIRLMPKIVNSVSTLNQALNHYASFASCLFKSEQELIKWRTMHAKQNLNATSIPIEPIKNFQAVWLPSIKDNVIFSQSIGNYQNQNKITYDDVLSRVQKLLATKTSDVSKHQKNKQWEILQSDSIKNAQNKQLEQFLQYRDYIPPILDSNIIHQFLSEKSNKSLQKLFHFIHILVLSPVNGNQVLKWAVQKDNLDILSNLGYSKQANNLAHQIFTLLCGSEKKQELSVAMVAHLDQGTKEAIAEGFTLMEKHIQPLIQLPSFDFLIWMNQSNWRFSSDKLSQLAANMNISSLILQYTEYIRITKSANQEYSQKIKSYEKIISYYLRIFIAKKQQMVSEKLKNKIEDEEYSLLITNQVASLKIFIDSIGFRDVLGRLIQFDCQVSKYNIAVEVKILPLAEQFNRIANQLAEGHIVRPNFLLTHRMSSNRVLQNFNMQLGSFIENYYLGTKKQFTYMYQPSQTKQIPFDQFLSAAQFPEPTIPKQKISEQQQKQSFKSLIEKLEKEKVLSVAENTLKLERFEESTHDSDLYKLGYLYKQGEQTMTLNPWLLSICKRQCLNWQMLKDLDAESYHHIKSVLVDEQIGKRKLTMCTKGKQLMKNGSNINVNVLNRQKYCNLIGRQCVGKGTLSHSQSFARGYIL